MSPAGRTVLGVSADYHDSAAALLVDGRIVAAVAEERLSRAKHDPALPVRAVEWVLEAAGVGPADLDAVAYHGKPLSTYERVIANHARVGPRGFGALSSAVRTWSGTKLWVGYRLERHLRSLGGDPPPTRYVEHHLGHAASAFHPSPFEHAAVVCADGVGEHATTSISHGTPRGLELLAEVRYPHSLGLLYSTMTAWCGFAVNDGESKLMGLAPYGRPRFAPVLRDRVIELRADGSFRLDLRWFDFPAGERMGRPRLAELLDGPPRRPDEPLRQRDADLAASIQVVLEEALLGVLRAAHDRTGERAVCLAGGVALNCVANGRLAERGPFDELWVQPAASDAGGALGAALWEHHVAAGHRREVVADAMGGCALGPSYGDDEVATWLADQQVPAERLDEAELLARTAADLDGGAIVGWFQGAAEFGPRALGNRSILADPRRAASVTRINAQVKRREGFRPLAPAVLAERAADLFARGAPSPYMLATDQVIGSEPVADIDLDGGGRRPGELLASVRSPLPAVTHVDGSARLQTVDERFGAFRRLLEAFDRRTGCPVLVNTSFNLAGEPIVTTPAEALRTAAAGGLDAVVVGAHRIDGDDLRRRLQP